jgi:hypothetical protein
MVASCPGYAFVLWSWSRSGLCPIFLQLRDHPQGESPAEKTIDDWHTVEEQLRSEVGLGFRV